MLYLASMSYPIGIRHSDAIKRRVRDLYSSGLSIRRAARRSGVSELSVYRWCKSILRSKSAALKNHTRTAEHNRKLARARRGKRATDTARRHMSEAQKRRGTVPPSQKGKVPWNFRGVTPKRELIRRTDEYKAWRNGVYTRDDYTCQLCFCRGGKLCAHHIKKVSNHPELQLEPTNGITLCEQCHVTKVNGHEREWEARFSANLKERGY